MTDPAHRRWPRSALLLALAGVAMIGAGLFFLLLRPALLAEDVRYMALLEAQLAAVRPALDGWLTHVFRVMGGHLLGVGVLTVTLAATAYREGRWLAWCGALVAGSVSIGWMSAVNFIIASDYKWPLFGVAVLWAASLSVFCLEWRARR